MTIHDVAFGGAGVGRLPDGKIVFVPYTITGETVRIRITSSTRDFARAELLTVLIPSPHRVSPPCPYFGRCGGCAYQHIAYEEQVRIKVKQLRDMLTRIGKCNLLPPIHVEAAPHPYGYRNKIVVHRGPVGQIGFYATDHRTVIDIEQCLIASQAVNTRLMAVRHSSRVPRHLEISDPEQRAGTPPGSFYQVHTAMAQRLLAWVRTQVLEQEAATLVDLYCGAGFFSLGMADIFASVYGIDRDAQAIQRAQMQSQGAEHVHFSASTVEEGLDAIFAKPLPAPITLLVDPPREGVDKRVITRLGQRGDMTRLIYVSCNPATLARDLQRFLQAAEQDSSPGRYRLVALGLFDMFPQTAHIEAVAIVRRESSHETGRL